jgi:hypothetical protein
MKPKLRRNMCGLPPYAMNNDIIDLPARREKYIGAPLVYACEFWINHLLSSNRVGDDTDGEIVELVNYFFEEHLLSWLEVLSIGSKLRVAVYCLHSLRSWLTDVRTPY